MHACMQISGSATPSSSPYLHECIHMYVCIYRSMCVHMHTKKTKWLHRRLHNTYIHKDICMYVCMYIHKYVCVYAYKIRNGGTDVCTIHTYIKTYVCMYIQKYVCVYAYKNTERLNYRSHNTWNNKYVCIYACKSVCIHISMYACSLTRLLVAVML